MRRAVGTNVHCDLMRCSVVVVYAVDIPGHTEPHALATQFDYVQVTHIACLVESAPLFVQLPPPASG